MKRIEYYMNLPYALEIIPDIDEGGFVAEYPELPGCITAGETMSEVVSNAELAKEEWMVAALEDGYPIPEPLGSGEYSGQFKLRIPKTLHRSLSLHAKKEGISMNQYCLYLLSRNDAIYSNS